MVDQEQTFLSSLKKEAEPVKKTIGFSKATGAAKLKVNSFTVSNDAR
jgi:hypothetical protein